jgi:hypothetical protein
MLGTLLDPGPEVPPRHGVVPPVGIVDRQGRPSAA